MHLRLSVLVAGSSVFLASPIPAQTAARACIDAHADAQLLRRDQRLIESHDKLVGCAVAACPQIIRRDCVEWLEQVKAAQPTLVLAAVDERGRDLGGVVASIDGKPERFQLDGRARTVDPGKHRLRFESAAGDVRESFIVVRQGEKERRVVAEFSGVPAGAPEQVGAEPRATASAVPTASYILGGVGVVGLSSFAFFALSGRSTERELERCAPSCARSDVDRMRREYLIADVSLGVGMASAGAATYLFLRNQKRAPTRERTGASVEVRPLVSDRTLVLRAAGRF